MGTLVLAARLALILALSGSAFFKLRALRSLPAQMRAFGIPAPLAAAAAILVPTAELAIAVSLGAFRDSPVPAFAAIGLLSLFTGAVVANLARAEPPPCPCFGLATADQPVSAWTIVGNAWLLALAVIATGTGDTTDDTRVLLAYVIGFAMTAVYLFLALGYGRRRRAIRQ
ncbi:MAG TPA: MauE/DoxX family redox-associated membrane protein [Acidimicrobiia bacterium]|nr:MauE/DoxX family redox-associated membrane protein [Acidimicrobiia bacterium]